MHANQAAFACALAPGAGADDAEPLALAEGALRAAPRDQGRRRHSILNTVGALLVRDGRYREATDRLLEGIQADPEGAQPQDWAFLAIAARAMGDAPSARRWRDRFESAPRPPGPWEAAEWQILRRELEVGTRPLPELPAEVFARPR